jgi:hypothetical protein
VILFCLCNSQQLQNKRRLTGNFENELPESDISGFADSKKKKKKYNANPRSF